jgi:hypothetical protein
MSFSIVRIIGLIKSVGTFFRMAHEIQIKQFEASEQDALLSFLRIAYPGEPLKSDFNLLRLSSVKDFEP